MVYILYNTNNIAYHITEELIFYADKIMAIGNSKNWSVFHFGILLKSWKFDVREICMFYSSSYYLSPVHTAYSAICWRKTLQMLIVCHLWYNLAVVTGHNCVAIHLHMATYSNATQHAAEIEPSWICAACCVRLCTTTQCVCECCHRNQPVLNYNVATSTYSAVRSVNGMGLKWHCRYWHEQLLMVKCCLCTGTG